MAYLKKFFTEGLIQVALLLSLCGVLVDVGLDPYLPPSWQDRTRGPTWALTQTQFHNFRNRLEDGGGSKNLDLDGFFTTRRLLGWVRSLDRLQVPEAQLETWLVQREQDQPPLLTPHRPPPTGMVREAELSVEATPPPEEMEQESDEERRRFLYLHGDEEERGEEEEGAESRGSAHNQEQTPPTLQECFRLLEETFPLTEEPQLGSRGTRMLDLDGHWSSIAPADHQDLENQWQDLFSIMEPENSDVVMTTSHNQAPPPGTPETPRAASDALKRKCENRENGVRDADPELQEGSSDPQLGFMWSPGDPALEPALLPLIPSAELDDQSSSSRSRDLLKNLPTNPFQSPPDYSDLLGEEPSKDSTSLNLLPQDSMDSMDDGRQTLYSEDLPGFDVTFHLRQLTPSSPVSSLEESDMNQDLLMSPHGQVEKEDNGDEDFPNQLVDLLEDATILDEMRLLDLALEEGFSPEIAKKLEEEGFFGCEVSNSGEDDQSEDQGPPGRSQEDADDEADSDSGLSLDFSHSPASPSASEASYSSSSSSSSSASSSSSYVTRAGSAFDDAEDGLAVTDMELEVVIKQEEVEEEVMGAVGGEYPEDQKKLFPIHHGNHKLLNGFRWLEHIGHDHTYNQPEPAASLSPPLDPSKSYPQRPVPGPYHYSSKMWSRDERRAKALKVPFSNELIVHMPVEEFNDLLTSHQLSEDQLSLVRDIRRRGKNKIAAQNCRKRKMDVLLGLEDDVTALRRRRQRLLRERQEALRNLQEMKRRLGNLYQEVFDQLRDEEGRQLDPVEFSLDFGPEGDAVVASQGGKTSKKLRNKKKK